MGDEISGVSKVKYDCNKWGEFLEKAKRRRGVKKTSEYEEYKKKLKKDMKNYADTRKEELNRAWEYYNYAITMKFFNKNYITLNDKHIKDLLSKCKIMVITANKIERTVLHHKIIENGSNIMTRILCESTAYYIFRWGKYWVAHIHQSQTGAGKDMGTSATISDALKFFTPNVIISLGVAFGIDHEAQNIGDVLVSKRLFPYSENKRDEDEIKPDRTQDKTIDDWLHVRLENAIGFLEGVTYGGILSGGSVMSSFEEKDRVCLGYTKPDYIIGGEMEGNAVFQYTKKLGIPGVVIKGICDWGVAKNDIYSDNPIREEKLKDSLQAFAMEQVVEKCNLLFNDKELFSTPKNIDTNKLNNKYYFCLVLLLVCQVLMIGNGLYELLFNYTNGDNEYIDFFYKMGSILELPIVWLAIPIVLLLIFVFIFIDKLRHNLIWWGYKFKKYWWK